MKLLQNSFLLLILFLCIQCDNSIYVKHVYTDLKKIGATPLHPVDTYEITRVSTIRTAETINTSRRKNIYYYTLPPIFKLVRFIISTGESGIIFLEDPESEDNRNVVLFKPAPDRYVVVSKMLCIVDKDEKLKCQ
jgi:hypothetical protein